MRLLLERLDYVGVLALELFAVGDRLLANEIAPRVHNSGHWTIEGARTSQFENHVRAVAGLPLGACDAIGRSAMVNLIGETPPAAQVLRRRRRAPASVRQGPAAGSQAGPRHHHRPRRSRRSGGRARHRLMRLRIPVTLRLVEFRRFWIGQSVSMLGDQVTIIALPLTAVLVLDATPAEMGYLTAAALVPNLIFSLHAGAWVDRRGEPAADDDRRRHRARPAAGDGARSPTPSTC